ncbi:MAG: BrnT family toxin [Planktomarina sp.]
MQIEWDDAKNATNKAKHGLDFQDALRIDWAFALDLETQIVDGEVRDLTVAPLDARLIAAVTTQRDGNRLRIISLRRAVNAEIKEWRKEFQNG